jgi:TldD protein
MKYFRNLLLVSSFLVMCQVSLFSQDKLIKLLDDEIKREMTELKKQEIPPFYIAYNIIESQSNYLTASFGNVINENNNKTRQLTVTVRVGDYTMDNTREIRSDGMGFDFDFTNATPISIEDNETAIRQALWNITNKTYLAAVDKFAKVKANVAVKVASEDLSDDFSKIEKPAVYFEPPLDPKDYYLNTNLWKTRLKNISAIYLNDKNIYESSAFVNYSIQRKYFVTSEGTKIAENYASVRMGTDAAIKSDDGMVLPLYNRYFAYKPQDLPSEDSVIKDAQIMVKKLGMLRVAPVVDPYSGPAILSGRAAGVFFHEIFGHRVEGHRQKIESEGQTFKKMINEKILPSTMTVYCDPSQKKLGNSDLNGYYKYDDEGIEGQKVTIVDKGILKDFLMSRNPITGFPKSNGHGRAESGYQPVSRQSNLVVTTSDPLTKEQLKKKLIDECKAQNKEYGYYFEDITGGFTITGRVIPNSFNVMPTEVYKVYVDGRPDELVRGVDLVGTPLSMFSQIQECGDTYEVFNGTCGAESGGVPVSCCSPSIFVKMIEMQKKAKSQEKPPLLPRPGSEGKTP